MFGKESYDLTTDIASPEAELDLDALLKSLLQLRHFTPADGAAQMKERDLELLCVRTREIFMEQPMLLEVDAPMRIAGDVHGQYFDLLRLFHRCGYPEDQNYLFLGDYVDRGKNSIECVALLFAYKVKFPENFFLLRGNHEASAINKIYGFHDECKRRYSLKLWKTFADVFNCMPVCAILADRIMCMHGGLSPQLRHFDQIRELVRPGEVPDGGLLCDLLWSDPSEEVKGWGDNERGVSFSFGSDVLRSFLNQQDLDLVVRAHQVCENGYEFFGGRQLVTVFSAPNYCREFDNVGAVLGLSEDLKCSFMLLKPEHRR
eukprot:TRINITY_DN72433_c0_g1_i1.p1 TRINITY_DN72433_c0_g1~~TRINITY_DN72433_c0_g1_i1.p1  ORF type:complete len:317 (+),score=59.56 TRINITY_DN72433_c0_g1_i1:344-1294(+)